MKTGYQGTFVISWAQTEIDGAAAAPASALAIGSCWRWGGEAVCVDGPRGLLLLGRAEGEAEVRLRAAKMVRRLLGAALEEVPLPEDPLLATLPELPDQSFTVTDGHAAWVVTLVEVATGGARLLMFSGGVPPRGADLWVVEVGLDTRPEPARLPPPGVICFTPGTLIDTPDGPRPVEALRPGDRVLTRDDGAQELLWIGSRRMTGARLHALPHLCPVRICAGAFGIGRPTGDLIVSPQHRMLIRGPQARALFNEAEVLVRACDLVNGGSVRVEQGLAGLHYIHLLFARHQVIRANGMESESFHPASTALEMISEPQRAGLLALLPEIATDPLGYGAFARRALSGSEAAILRHDLAA
ncbi:Hint domain-containing protein [Paenirhodobacter hankyongi]|uniref:Hemolysin-type calcium-binding protein n=1 Tax=Paenirhodobacter hankyongi TaxID=2294033 RepID=A0A421BX01_9RHOB|nr:Hint domain-containing protein [Sinirhodobacter hankyongi]RLL72840.1 hemolysin-type calcium-binding protein [Sinirhodobacter hankyongi]